MTAQAEGMAPGLTLWGNARKLAEDENPRGLNFAQFEDVRLEPGLYGISAWTVRGEGCYRLEVSATLTSHALARLRGGSGVSAWVFIRKRRHRRPHRACVDRLDAPGGQVQSPPLALRHT